MVLEKAKIGYILGKTRQRKFNYFLFMNDLKFFPNNRSKIDLLVQTINIYCKGVSMKFGISTCTVLKRKLRKRVASAGIELPTGETISGPKENGYKYLGIL